jgi:DNA-binding HxlR family transcriptional regulator
MSANAAKIKTVQEAPSDPRVEMLVNEMIGQVADKWTMIILEVLTQHGELRFSQIGKLAGGISQKMLTQTLR